MATEEKQLIKIRFPFNLYFRQLFSADTYVKFINPFSFWRRYRINHLETCQNINTVEHIKRCHQIEWQPEKKSDYKIANDFNKSSTSACLPFEQITPNTILVFQPSIKLKYRGVTYQTNKILGININNVNIEIQQVKVKSIEQSSNSCRIDTLEIFDAN